MKINVLKNSRWGGRVDIKIISHSDSYRINLFFLDLIKNRRIFIIQGKLILKKYIVKYWPTYLKPIVTSIIPNLMIVNVFPIDCLHYLSGCSGSDLVQKAFGFRQPKKGKRAEGANKKAKKPQNKDRWCIDRPLFVPIFLSGARKL